LAGDAQQVFGERRVRDPSAELCIGPSGLHVRVGRRGCGLVGGRLGVEIAGRGGGACALDAAKRACVEYRLRKVRARVDRVDRALELAVGIEHRRLAGRGGKVNAEGGCVQRAPVLERGRREVGHNVGTTLCDARAGLFGAVTGGDDGGVLLGGEPGRVAE